MAEETAKEEIQKKGGGKKKLFLFLVLGVLIIAIAGAGLFLFLGKKGHEAEEMKSGKKGKKKIENTVFMDFDPVIVNLLDPTGKRYLQVRMSIEVADKKDEAEIKKKEPMVKDVILHTLSGKTVEEVIMPEAKEKIKQDLIKKINEALGDELVLNVYITQYIVE